MSVDPSQSGANGEQQAVGDYSANTAAQETSLFFFNEPDGQWYMFPQIQ